MMKCPVCKTKIPVKWLLTSKRSAKYKCQNCRTRLGYSTISGLLFAPFMAAGILVGNLCIFYLPVNNAGIRCGLAVLLSFASCFILFLIFAPSKLMIKKDDKETNESAAAGDE